MMSSRSAVGDSPALLRVRGYRWPVLGFALPFATVGMALGIALAVATGDEAGVPNFFFWAALFGVLLTLYVVLLFFYWSIREVAVGPEGVRFTLGARSHFATWNDLHLSEFPPALGGIGFHITNWVPDSRPPSNGVMVTIAQARAILGHPNCPRWPVPEKVRTALGLLSVGPKT